MLEFTSYFSSSKGNLYSLSDGETLLMLECGISIKKIKEAFNYQTHKIAGVLLTHGHISDHAKAVKDVAKAGLDIYTSMGTLMELKVSGHRFHPIKAYEEFEIGSFRVKPFPAVHDTLEPLGFFIASGDDKFMFQTDSAFVKHRFKGLTGIAIAVDFDLNQLKKNVDLGNIHPSLAKRIIRNHMSLQNAIEFFKANDMSQVECIHLLHLSSTNSDPEHFRDEIQKVTGRPTYLLGD